MRGLILIPFYLFSLLIGRAVFAQTTNTIITEAPTEQNTSILSNFSGKVGLAGKTDFKEASDESKSSYTELDLYLNYKINDKNKLGLWLPTEKDLSDNYEEKINDMRLSYSRSSIYKNGIYSLSFKGTGHIPLSEKSKDKRRLQTTIELSPVSSIDLARYATGLSFTYIPRYKRNFHEYETDINGKNMVEQALVQFFVLGYEINDRWSVGSTLVYVKSRQYNGTDKFDSYLTAQDLSYQINDSASVSVGIETGGSIKEIENGQNENIKIFDKDSTEFYASMSLGF